MFPQVVICDTGLCEGRDYELLVQFEASPEPDEVGSQSTRVLCYVSDYEEQDSRCFTNPLAFQVLSRRKSESILKCLKTGGMGDESK